MAWLGKVSLGGFPDLAGAVTKLSESVKNIEKNFDNALGLEEKYDSDTEGPGVWASTSESIGLFEPVMAFMGHTGDENASDSSVNAEYLKHPSSIEEPKEILAEGIPASKRETTAALSEEKTKEFTNKTKDVDSAESDVTLDERPTSNGDIVSEKLNHQSEKDLSMPQSVEVEDDVPILKQKSDAADEVHAESLLLPGDSRMKKNAPYVASELHDSNDLKIIHDENEAEASRSVGDSAVVDDAQVSTEMESSGMVSIDTPISDHTNEMSSATMQGLIVSTHVQPEPSDILPIVTDASNKQLEAKSEAKEPELHGEQLPLVAAKDVSVSIDLFAEVERMKQEMKMMEAALQGAARQAQAKADEIAKLMTDNEQLKTIIEDMKKKSAEAEIDSLRDEYHQRVSSLERKVYALTRERDTLRREQNKKSDATALLKEKDEIISQVMAEGEELSKKQAAQEATIRKLRAQIRDFEEEKQRLNSKLQVEEAKVESMKRDKATTEKLLQETIEKNQAELSSQKEFYVNALTAAKEAEALAEARVNNEARIELESRLKEANEREAMLVQTLEELRHSLSRMEQQAVFKEEMLRRDIDDLQKRYQASELRYNELNAQIPESTRPLLRQIEAMQETAARRAEAWAGVERALNSRLQVNTLRDTMEAEAKAAAAEEKERTLNDHLSQSLSRITVLETQITCLRTEQTQLRRSLEKERQRASEGKQEYLIAKEEAATQEGRARQLEDEIKELRAKHKKEIQEELARKDFLEKELEREKAAKAELEKSISHQTPVTVNQVPSSNMPLRNLSSTGKPNAIEESIFLQASLDSSDNIFPERRTSGEMNLSPYFLKTMTPSAFEAALRQKDGELSSYMTRLASLESIRNSLAEELVKMTEQCEKLRAEAVALPSLRAELEALRRRHSSALELMGERDEELEELRADIVDLKEMYREQVDLLVNKINMISSASGMA